MNSYIDEQLDVIHLGLDQALSGLYDVSRYSHPYVVLYDFFCDTDDYGPAHMMEVYFCKTIELAKDLFRSLLEEECGKRLKCGISDLLYFEGLEVEGCDESYWAFQIKRREDKPEDYIISTKHATRLR